ncbi:site-specific DNA-methyltransferase [Curtobacterium sp. MCBD17_019]|uniref:DNA-methyltransferase n=1 Tax=Curtobacterium sp. MCBD17_019 TaxID=2175669 RepID=UPI000DA9A570|nr:site-specific DNA-methyltransferase [Curtobacterium sp. MCBD17_019]PZE75340.1 site-specific DNA-methyltransferase [Curtobacterium sp. MCBD17_019]
MNALPRNTILEGDALTTLAHLPDESIDQIITSPPYFRLRDYGVAGQLGLETSVDGWVSDLRAVLAQCARVLVPTGTLWLNLGDTYSTKPADGGPRKSLLLGPERLALALLTSGWTIRNKIIWAKTNTVPTSVRDRLATKHEMIYLLTRSPRYFFALNEIREPHTSRPPKPRETPAPSESTPAWLGPNSDGGKGLALLKSRGLIGHPLGKNPGDVWSLAVSNFRGEHFATFPEALVERMLRAGCPRWRCTRCHRPWRAPPSRTTVGEPLPTCDHDAPREPGLVLDPFMGAGTTALVARRLGRDYLGIELNPAFRQLALDRLDAA